MSPPCPQRSRRPLLGPIAVALLALASACSDREVAESRQPTGESEPLARSEGDRVEPSDAELQKLRALGYGTGGSFADSQSAPEPAEAKPAPTRVAPDTGALSELDYRNAQNLSQQANEARDYLGAQRFASSREGSELEASGPPPSIQSARQAQILAMQRRAAAWALDGGAAEIAISGAEEGASRGRHARRDAGGGKKRGAGEPGSDRSPDPLSPARRFQQERRSLENLRFQPSAGYWANTYVPGDPVLRWLESRLGERDRAALQAFASRPLVLDAAARQIRQPFDPPGSAALSLFVQADRRGLEQEQRMLVQVGLQGARRRGGLRPAMSVGIVLDARGTLAPDDAASVRALLDAFLQAKDVGDRFSLRVAGAPGARWVGPDEFRHGPLSLALKRLFGGGEPPSGPALGLVAALEQTVSELQRGDDPTAPLGSSLVLLVTSQPLGPYTDALTEAAHRSAVTGVPVSVVAVGDGADAGEIERVTLAGQGNRRLLHAPAEADALVDRELSSLARVIARALRLNIRLAPGVRLVEVVGADRLDAAGAQRVRKAEQSIDRRLARNLGIEKDRGEDEDGIQIVIPAFYSGDSHAVLLDVVAAGPGPIADVTVRYKDLVYLRNSVARANLTLGRGDDPAGPLERNVVKNYLAVRLAGALKRAGRSLLEGGDAETLAVVSDFRALLESLRREVPGFQNDPELATDSAMLGEYLALLQTNVLDQSEPRRTLADSLQLSGYFKTVPRPTPVARTARR